MTLKFTGTQHFETSTKVSVAVYG